MARTMLAEYKTPIRFWAEANRDDVGPMFPHLAWGTGDQHPEANDGHDKEEPMNEENADPKGNANPEEMMIPKGMLTPKEMLIPKDKLILKKNLSHKLMALPCHESDKELMLILSS